MNKIKVLASLVKLTTGLKKKGKRIVFTNGCFDIIHPGHIKILKEAKDKGEVLVVGLNSDSSIRKIKGPSRPIMNQRARTRVLSAIEYVDFIVLFDDNTPLEIIKKIKPDVLVKGEDWEKDKIIGREFAKKIFRIKFHPGYSTSAIIEKIKNG
ncbi:MAG: adenylyltransferase/cytidyltransferase family protein [Candidatus Omnitrophota bacterium]|jgi:rfaE bifunctional protein nucleotidyltransferase chain/domain